MTFCARIENVAVVETFAHPFGPTPLFDPSWTWVKCPEGTKHDATYDGGAFTNSGPAPEPEAPTPVYFTSMTPIRLKLSLGQSARLAIRTAVAYEGADVGELAKKAILGDWWTSSTTRHLSVSASKTLTSSRRSDISFRLASSPKPSGMTYCSVFRLEPGLVVVPKRYFLKAEL